MSEHQLRKSILIKLKQMYKLPELNTNFSLSRSLPFALVVGLGYGFIFYLLSEFLGGIGNLNYVMGFVGVVAGTVSNLVSDRWNIFWAVDVTYGPIITFIVFFAAWYILN
jgi:hypothetical protein